MSENMSVYEKVRSVPQEALKPINGGRLKGMSDINPMWRIKMLTELFGICGVGWKVEITDRRLERGEGVEIVCFVDINLFVKVDGEWSAPIPGMGGSSFVTMEKHGPYTSDECFKMAYTDAISVACKSLGFAADVYFANDRTKYSSQGDGNAPTQPQKPAQAQSSQQSSRPPQAATSQAGASGGSPQFRVYKLREELNWSWPDLNQFAGETLGRPVKFLKNDVKDKEDWEKIEQAMIATKEGVQHYEPIPDESLPF